MARFGEALDPADELGAFGRSTESGVPIAEEFGIPGVLDRPGFVGIPGVMLGDIPGIAVVEPGVLVMTPGCVPKVPPTTPGEDGAVPSTPGELGAPTAGEPGEPGVVVCANAALHAASAAAMSVNLRVMVSSFAYNLRNPHA